MNQGRTWIFRTLMNQNQQKLKKVKYNCKYGKYANNILENLLKVNMPIFLLGDFNIELAKNDRHTKRN